MKTKVGLSILLVLVIVGALAVVKTLQIKTLIAGSKAFSVPPVTVASSVVKEEKWQEMLTAIGSVTAVQGVTITPDIPGSVRDITFERNKTLHNQEMISQSDLDSSEAALKQNIANADAIKATIEKKTIRAPFEGQLGIRQVNLGQYLDIGKPIVSLQSLSPVYADFSLPQQELSKIKLGMRVRISSDTYPGRQFEGSLTAINPDLDPNTRSVTLQATINNADHALRPGMYAKIEVLLPKETAVLAVPSTSILSAPFGDSVYVIEPANDSKQGFTV